MNKSVVSLLEVDAIAGTTVCEFLGRELLTLGGLRGQGCDAHERLCAVLPGGPDEIHLAGTEPVRPPPARAAKRTSAPPPGLHASLPSATRSQQKSIPSVSIS